jgi:hypothetical protein
MSSPRRALVASIAVAALSLAALCRWGRPDRDRHAERWHDAERWYDRERELSRRLDRAAALTSARILFKEALLQGLEGGRLTLLEAAARMADYHDREPAAGEMGRGSDVVRAFPGRTERERCARAMVLWVRARAGPQPSEAALRVERELAEAYGEPGAAAQPAE